MRLTVPGRVLLALAVAFGGVSAVGVLGLLWTDGAFPGKELVLGLMAAFWFGGWVLVEALFVALAYWWLLRSAVPERLPMRQAYGAFWLSGLLLVQYLCFKWAWGNEGYTEIARRALLPVHLSLAVLVLVLVPWQRGPSWHMAVWLAVQALGDALTPPGGSPLGGWFGLAVGGLALLMMVKKGKNPDAEVRRADLGIE